MHAPQTQHPSFLTLTDGGKTGVLIRAFDWSTTPLGPPDGWPQPLKTLVGVMLGSSQPMFVAWGPQRTLIYNEAYSEILAAKHPAALGCDFLDVWREIRADLVPIVDQAYSGKPVHMDDIELLMHRRGYPEETHFSFFYAPVRDEDGAVAGLYCACTEITGQVLSERRRRVAEAALRESEARFRLMADAVPQIVWITAADGRAEFFNRQWAEYVGTPEIPPTAADVADRYIHPDDRGPTMAAFEEAQRAGGVFQVEHRIRRKDGAWRWFLVRAEPYRDAETGEILRWFGASTDIHDRKLAEARLRELNATLEQQIAERTAERDRMWNTSPDLMIIIDFEGNIRRVNPAWTALLGYEADELVGRHVNEFVVPEDHGDTVAAYETLAAGERIAIENCYRHKDGSTRHIAWVAAPAGDLIYATGRDVTLDKARQEDLAAAEAARREADALYRAYFENTPEALFVIGVEPDGGFVVEEVNPAHEKGVGFKLAEIRGKRIEEILPERPAQQVMQAYRRVIRTGETLQYREVFEVPGEPQHWDTTMLPVRDETGRIVRLIGSSRNVTRQVVAEEALRQSQKMEAMGQLTGGVAHDFNNLLTPIVGALDMLQRKGLGGEREQRLIAGAAQSAERARTLVQRLLAFARRQPLQPVAVDVAELVDGMAGLIASTTGPQIKVVVDAAHDLPPAKADPNQLEMAVLNLAVNARDAMPEGGTLRISVEAATIGRQHRTGLRPGRYLQLSVADTGTGMDEATLTRAVEPFFSTKGVGKGTGLGLSMVHGLASQLGGAVTISSTPGMGTNVELWLPQDEREAVATEPLHEDFGAAPGRGKALLVDDEDLVRLSTADMLIELGWDVVEASSAEEALRLLNRGLNPQVVVTDHLMPGMSGTDLARAIQSERPAIKVLIVSGYAETAGIAPDLPRLTKPFRSAELAASLAGL